MGRPIGLLTNWLRAGAADDVNDRHAHVHFVDATDRAERIAARSYFLSLPGGEEFARRAERAPRPGEAAEPWEIK